MKGRGLLVLLLVGCGTPPRGSATPLHIAVFQSDATPPIGHPGCGGWIKPLEKVDTPLLLKGIVLDDRKARYVIAALDWCVLANKAHDIFRRKLAAGAGTSDRNVTVHCTHTHSALIADARAQEILSEVPGAPPHIDLTFLERCTDSAADAVRQAVLHFRPLTHVGTGAAKVEHFASNRRVPGPDGKIRVRYSSTKDASLRAEPEGLIDPMLRTVTFFEGEEPIVRLHYYASHPQSYYGDGKATPDTVGLAREYLEREEGVRQIYFTGCAGNVTAGKYNDGSHEARGRLSKEIYSGMIRAAGVTRKEAVSSLDWSVAQVAFARRTEASLSEEALRKDLADPKGDAARRIKAALGLSWYERLKSRPTVEITRLRIGRADIVHLPGEAFVEYQLYAQEQRPDRFVCVASYGEGGTGYICMDKSYAEGGYEPTYSFVGPPSEGRLKEAIRGLLK